MCFLKGKHELMRDKQFPGFLGTITLHPVAGVLFESFYCYVSAATLKASAFISRFSSC